MKWVMPCLTKLHTQGYFVFLGHMCRQTTHNKCLMACPRHVPRWRANGAGASYAWSVIHSHSIHPFISIESLTLRTFSQRKRVKQ